MRGRCVGTSGASLFFSLYSKLECHVKTGTRAARSYGDATSLVPEPTVSPSSLTVFCMFFLSASVPRAAMFGWSVLLGIAPPR